MKLQLNNLSKSYGDIKALKKINLTLTPGIYGLLGPNGSGKSTMMNLITGNLKPSSGDILWNNQKITEQSSSFYHHLGYMPQIQTFYPDFTALEFMYYIASLKGMNRSQTVTETDDILTRLELYEVRNKKVRTFSGGMRQRLLLGQALLNSPKLLILDEPTAGMDPKQRVAISRLIGERASDSIVLISTHVVSDIEFIAKEVILLRKGKILQKGNVSQLCASIQGKVFDVNVSSGNTDCFDSDDEKIITGYIRNMNGIHARIIRETPPAYPAEETVPSLEDVYMYCFGESEHAF